MSRKASSCVNGGISPGRVGTSGLKTPTAFYIYNVRTATLLLLCSGTAGYRRLSCDDNHIFVEGQLIHSKHKI